MKRLLLIVYFRLTVGLILGLAIVTASAATEFTAEEQRDWGAVQASIELLNRPQQVTTDDIVRVLEMKGQFTNSKTMIEYIGSRAYDNLPLNFSMTERDVSRLKRAGATPELIAAMRSPQSVAHAPIVFGPGGIIVPASGSSSGGQTNVELILDASGSMAAKIQGRTKMDIAKQALTELLLSIPSTTNVAVRAYGHRKKDDCADLELIANFGEARSSIPAKVNALKPLGKTPLSGSINASARDFAGKEGQENTVILITDGEETCNADPCAAAKAAHQSGIKVKINVIGFKIEAKERAQLECIANAGGGKYVSANDAAELTAATQQVAAPVMSPPPPAPAPAATANPMSDNILAAQNGGQLLVAPEEDWKGVNDGKEESVELIPGQEAVFAFKDEEPATFDNFATLVNEASDRNLKEFELLVGDESPTGTFRSLGTFTSQNAKLLKSPYQPFKFEPVTAKYLKIKLISNYGAYQRLNVAEFKITGQTNQKSSETEAKPKETKAETPNILAVANGGQLLVAPEDDWTGANDGKEEARELLPGQEAVFAFKDEKPATFDRFATLVTEASDRNLKEFELLVGDESPTGTFRSIGTFTAQNAKMMKSPYQEFKFEPVTAKYLKVKLISNYGAYQRLNISEFKVYNSSGK